MWRGAYRSGAAAMRAAWRACLVIVVAGCGLAGCTASGALDAANFGQPGFGQAGLRGTTVAFEFDRGSSRRRFVRQAEGANKSTGACAPAHRGVARSDSAISRKMLFGRRCPGEENHFHVVMGRLQRRPAAGRASIRRSSGNNLGAWMGRGGRPGRRPSGARWDGAVGCLPGQSGCAFRRRFQVI